MIKSGLKKYFVNLKYYFTPVGTLAVGMIIGLSILIPGAIAALKEFINEFVDILQNNNIDFNPTKDYIVNSITSLDWNDPIEALKTMIGGEWLKTLIDGSVELIGIELKAYADMITASFNEAVAVIVALVVVFVFFCILGLISGYMLTRFLVRRNMAKRGIWKTIFASFLDSVITTALLALSIWLAAVWTPSIIFTTIFSLAVFAFTSLLEAYLIHGRSKVKFSAVMRLSNAVKLILCDLIIFVISVALLLLSIALTNKFAGIFIGFAFVEIAFIVIALNAESYVKDMAEGIAPPEERAPDEPAAA